MLLGYFESLDISSGIHVSNFSLILKPKQPSYHCLNFKWDHCIIYPLLFVQGVPNLKYVVQLHCQQSNSYVIVQI